MFSSPVLTDDQHGDASMEMSFDNEIDSGIWDMVLGRESQMSVHELSAAHPDLHNGHPKSLGTIFPGSNEDEGTEMAYIPDADPVMSYKVMHNFTGARAR